MVCLIVTISVKQKDNVQNFSCLCYEDYYSGFLLALNISVQKMFMGEHWVERDQGFLQESVSFIFIIREWVTIVIEARETCIAYRLYGVSPTTQNNNVIENATFSSCTPLPHKYLQLQIPGLPFYALEIFGLELNRRVGWIAFASYLNTD